MRLGEMVFRYHLSTYTDRRKAGETRLAIAVRRAGGFEDLGSGIGESNATAARGFEDLGSRIGESRTIEVGDSIALDDIPAENTSARSPVRKSKCGFSFRQHGVAEFIGAPETSNPEVINESMIT